VEQPLDPEIREVLDQHTPESQQLALLLRARIHSLVTDIEEEAYLDWGQIGFACGSGMKRQFCAIGLQETRVDLIFNRGTDLEDPAGLLEGVGKRARNVRLTSAEQLHNPALDQLIRDAARIAESET
jgi:hypothetical protein